MGKITQNFAKSLPHGSASKGLLMLVEKGCWCPVAVAIFDFWQGFPTQFDDFLIFRVIKWKISFCFLTKLKINRFHCNFYCNDLWPDLTMKMDGAPFVVTVLFFQLIQIIGVYYRMLLKKDVRINSYFTLTLLFRPMR